MWVLVLVDGLEFFRLFLIERKERVRERVS